MTIRVATGEHTLEAQRKAAAAALSAATAEAAAGPTYASEAAGLAATTSGQAFAVDNGDGTVTVYLNDAGVAVEQRTLATTAALAANTGAGMIGTGAPGILTNVEEILQHVNAAAYFGIATSGSNAAEHVQDVIDDLGALALQAGQGAILRLKPGENYDWEVDPAGAYANGLVIRSGVTLDLQGAAIARRCHGDNERGFILMSHSALRNGAIDAVSEFVSVAGTILGTQRGIHGPVGLGAIYGQGGTVAAPSEFENTYNWEITNLTLTADKDYEDNGAMLIQGYGNCHAGLIRNIYAPASATVQGVIGFDWGWIGDDFDASDEAAFGTWQTSWTAGTLRTTHPSNVRVSEVHAGALTRPNIGQDTGTFLFRFSGCRGIQVSNSSGDITTDALIKLTAGDTGFEFADTAARTMGMDGSSFTNIEAKGPQHGYLADLQSYADNLARAISDHAYANFTDPLVFAGLVVDGLRGFTDQGAAALEGIRCTLLKGATITNSAARGFKKNLWIDEGCVDVDAYDNSFTLARENNIYMGHAGTPPVNCKIYQNEVHTASRGSFGTHDSVLVEDHLRCAVYDNTFGVDGENDSSTRHNLRISGGTGIRGWGNKHKSTSAAGIAELVLSGEGYDEIDRWEVGDMLEPAVIATPYSGALILPTRRFTDLDGVRRGRFRAARASLSGDTTPPAGTWTKGDIIFYLETDASGGEGSACTTSGTLGTLAGVTGGITTGTKALVVNDASALKVGQYITIAGVTGTKKITAISGLNVTIDSNADATVAGAAVAFSAAVFKQISGISA